MNKKIINEYIINKTDDILLFLVASAFLFFYFFLSYQNRFASDDYEFIRIFRQNGLLGSLKHSYNLQTFRFPAVLIFDIFFGKNIYFENIHYMIFLYHSLTMVIFIYAVYNLITNLSKLFLNILPYKKYRIIFSVIFIASFFFGTIQTTDTWFWLISSCVHLQGCVFAILGFSFVLKNKKNFLNKLIIIFCFIIAAGVSENFALLLIITIFSLIIFFLIKIRKKKIVYPEFIFRKLVIALVVAIISFLINISGSGINVRIKNLNEFDAIAKVKVEKIQGTNQSFKYSEVTKLIFRKKNIAFVLFASLWAFAGFYFRYKNIKIDFISKKYFLINFLKISFIIIAASTLIVLLPLYIFFHGPGPLRAWTPLSLVITMFFNSLFLIIGYKFYSKIFHYFFKVIAVLCLIIMLVYIFRQSDFAIKYSKKYDERSKYLLQLNSAGNKKTIDVKGLPDSGMITNGDITEDENFHLNKDYTFALGLNFKVKSSDNYFKCFTDSTNIVY